MKVVCLGDSITFGQHLPSGQAWPALLKGWSVAARGVPSDTTRLGLERFPRDVQEQQPDVVVIQFGHNDCNRWRTDRGLPRVSADAFRANLEEMVDRCAAFDADPVLCTLTPSQRSSDHARDTAVYDQIVRTVADFEEVALADVRAAFTGQPGLLLEDGLHLSTKGHRVYATVVQQALARFGVPADLPDRDLNWQMLRPYHRRAVT